MTKKTTSEEHVLPPEHEQAGARFPRVGEVIESSVFGETADDWKEYPVQAVSPTSGRPVVAEGSTRAVVDDFEWRWPNGGPPETQREVPCPRR